MTAPENAPSPQKTTLEKYKSLPKRVLTSCIFLSLLAGIIYLDLTQFQYPWSLSFLGLVAGACISIEYFQIASHCGQKPFMKTGVFFTALLFSVNPLQKLLAQYSLNVSIEQLQIWTLISALCVCFYLQGMKPVCEKVFEGVASTISGIIYIGLMGSFLIHTAWVAPREDSKLGIKLLIFSILVIKMTDIGAFMIGVAFGKHKWIPRISPGKSIEGLIGGVLSATLLAFLLNQYVNIFDHTWKVIAYGLIIAYVGQLSDLIESIFKRCGGLKDSGNLLPGFGGIFDLMDSLIVSAPISYFLFYWFI